MVLGIAKKHPLTFSLSLNIIQGSCSTFPFPLLLQQLAFKLLVTLLGHVEGVHDSYPSPLLFLHLSMGIVHNLLGPKYGLDGLEGKRSTVLKKKKKTYHSQVPLQAEEDLMLPHGSEVSHILGQ